MSRMPFPAQRLALSCLPSPRDLENREFMPTPMPVAKPIMRFWTGKARESAVTALSEILEI